MHSFEFDMLLAHATPGQHLLTMVVAKCVM